MASNSPYRTTLKMLRGLGPLDMDFVADHLGLTVTGTRQLLDALQKTGAIQNRGEIIMIADDTREPALESISRVPLGTDYRRGSTFHE